MGNGIFEINVLKELLDGILKLIYPERETCIFCKSPLNSKDEDICPSCRESLPFINYNTCPKCGRIMEYGDYKLCSFCENYDIYFDGASSVFDFTGAVKDAVYSLKYDGEKQYGEALGKFMAQKLCQKGWHIDAVVPVPLHSEKLKWRGYNQSQILSSVIGRENGIDVYDNALVRVRNTKSQVGSGAGERLNNVRDAFILNNKDMVYGKSILLVDDIMTTGATLNECSRVLRSGHPKNIYCLTLACPSHIK